MTEAYKDAIGNCTCGTCPYFHQQVRGPYGLCIIDPPKPFVVGMVPVGGPLVDPTKPQQMLPDVRGYYPPVEERGGCGRHPERAENRKTMGPLSAWTPPQMQ